MKSPAVVRLMPVLCQHYCTVHYRYSAKWVCTCTWTYSPSCVYYTTTVLILILSCALRLPQLHRIGRGGWGWSPDKMSSTLACKICLHTSVLNCLNANVNILTCIFLLTSICMLFQHNLPKLIDAKLVFFLSINN
jgi:hypothetical protein